MTFKSKPRLIEAEQFFADKPLPFQNRGPYVAFDDGHFYVITAHGQRAILADGDWIVPEPSGPHVLAFAAYPVKPDIFAMNYEPEPKTTAAERNHVELLREVYEYYGAQRGALWAEIRAALATADDVATDGEQPVSEQPGKPKANVSMTDQPSPETKGSER